MPAPTDPDEGIVDLDEAQVEDLRRMGLEVIEIGDELQQKPDFDT